MRTYDPSQPLIFIHIPKTAGRSVKEVVNGWFPKAVIPHYESALTEQPPQIMEWSKAAGSCVYGHFNRSRGFSVEHSYPEAKQFVTILRDPLEQKVSTYFYIRKAGANWKDQSRVPKSDLETYLTTAPSTMLNHFPRPVTWTNYRDMIDNYFVAIGLTERLSESLSLISSRLGKHFEPSTLRHINSTPRTGDVPDQVRQQVREMHTLEYAVYDYASEHLELDGPVR